VPFITGVKMPWTKILLSGDDLKSGEVKRLQAKFRDAFMMRACLQIWPCLQDSQPPQDTIHLYLTPACAKNAENFISEYAGVSCEKPEKSGLEPTMVIGFNRDGTCSQNNCLFFITAP
jgi:hypothetical protein